MDVTGINASPVTSIQHQATVTKVAHDVKKR